MRKASKVLVCMYISAALNPHIIYFAYFVFTLYLHVLALLLLLSQTCKQRYHFSKSHIVSHCTLSQKLKYWQNLKIFIGNFKLIKQSILGIPYTYEFLKYLLKVEENQTLKGVAGIKCNTADSERWKKIIKVRSL